MTVAISRLLDVMVNVMVKDVNRTEDFQPLVAVLDDLRETSDVTLQFQVHYALQASQYIPDDESTLQAVLRFAGGVSMAVLGVASVCKLDPANLFSSLETLRQATGQLFEVTKSILEGLEASQRGRFGAMQSLVKGIRTGTKHEWYLVLLAARSFVRDGRLADFKKTVCEAPCRDQRSFQLGVCQILGDIAMEPLWDSRIRHQAIDFLDALSRNIAVWKQHSDVKQLIFTSLTQILALSDATINNHTHAVLQDLGHDQASNTTTSATTFHSLHCRLPSPELSPLLARVHQIPYVEYDLHALRVHRLKECHQPVYIPPMAKASLQARNDDLFSLMDKVQEFLDSEHEVMLVLGDSGAGKSTFNRHLEHHLWTIYNKGDPIPLFINLPAIDRPDLDLITKQLQIHNLKDDQIQELKQHRKFILICDGYDESQLTANLYKTNRLNEQNQWSAKMLISCRTQYLGPFHVNWFVPQHADMYKSAQMGLFQEAIIAPFSREQVKGYVVRYVLLEPRLWVTEDYMRMLTTIPNLMDLVKNPFLLTLTLEALPGLTKGQQNLSTIKATRVQLYDHFVNMWLDVNMRRLQNSALSSEDRAVFNQLVNADFISKGLRYSTGLSVAIFEQQDGNPVIRYVHIDDKNTWRARFFGLEPDVQLLQASSPLIRAGNQFQFLHRSMLEYFFSRAVFDPIGLDDKCCFSSQAHHDYVVPQTLDTHGPLFTRNLLTEPSVVQFLCDRVKQHSGFEKQFLAVIKQSKTDPTAATAAANAITILVRASVRLNGADLRGIRIPGADLSGSQLDSAQLQDADLTGVAFARSWLRQANLSRAQMDGVRFGELPSLKEEGVVFVCAYSPDGRMLAVGGDGRVLSIYDTKSWDRVYQHSVDDAWVTCVAFSPNNQQLLFGTVAQSMRLWTIASKDTVLLMEGHAGWTNSVSFSPCGKQCASASDDMTVRLWNSETGECVFELKGHTGNVIGVVYCTDGKRLVSSSTDGTIRLWDSDTGEQVTCWNITRSDYSTPAFSADGQWIAVALGVKIRIMNSLTGELSAVLHNTSGTRHMAFSPNAQWIVTSSDDSTVRLWDLSSGFIISSFSGHARRIRTCAFSPNGFQIASGNEEGCVKLWEVDMNQAVLDVDRPTGLVFAVTYSPDGRSILSGSDGQGVQLWGSQTGVPVSLSLKMGNNIWSLTFSPDGNQIATGHEYGTIQLWGRQADTAERTLFGLFDRVTQLVYSPCGRWIVSISDSQARLWDLHTDKYPNSISLTDWSGLVVFHVAFTSTGQIVLCFESGTIRLHDPRAQDPCTTLKEISMHFTICSVDCSPNGQELAIAAENGKVYLWDFQSDKPGIELKGQENRVFSVAFSPCGKWILAGSAKKVRLWRFRTGDAISWSCVAVIGGCSNNILSLAWNPVVTTLEFVTGCVDGSVRVWRIGSHDNADGGDVPVQMLWGNDIGLFCALDLVHKGAIGLSPINQKLLLQRDAIDDSPRSEGHETNVN